MEYSPNLTARYLAGKIDEYVKFQGRDTLTSNAARDDRARWARIPDGKACDFCNMLGSRGFVYRSAEKAGEHNDYHPHCNCQVAVCFEPDMDYYVKNGVRVPRGYDPNDPEHAMLIDDLYAEYVAAGKRYTSSSTYRRYERTRMPTKDFDAAMRRLSEARTPEELRRVGREIVDQWPGGAINADRAQWDELSRHARELDREFKNGKTYASLRYLNSHEQLYLNADNIVPELGYEDVVAHCDGLMFEVYNHDADVERLSKSYDVNVLDFANWIKQTPSYDGNDIRLIACSAGNGDDCAAQLLSDILGVKIKAPVGDVAVYPDGSLFVDIPGVPRDRLMTPEFQEECWKVFEPRRN